ncbi:MAG: HEAT repeat domain-containing protein [Gammaproteobacteria bacterium]
MTTSKLQTAISLMFRAGLFFAEANAYGASQADTPFFIDTENTGVFRAEARQTRWESVFNGIAHVTGIRIHYPAQTPGTVTAVCKNKTIPQLMECLLGSEADLVFRYPSDSQQKEQVNLPAEIWVLNTSFDTERITVKVNELDRCTPDDTPKKPVTCGQRKTTSTTTEATPSIADKTRQLLEATRIADPVLRADAVASLATEDQIDDAAVHEALATALSDENPNVRAQALFGLTQRGEAGAALQAALQDSDAAVRLMVVDIVENDSAILEQALGDNDETVRSLAALKLKLLSHITGSQ